MQKLWGDDAMTEDKRTGMQLEEVGLTKDKLQRLQSFHPVLSAWFRHSFGEPTDVQRRSWDAIAAGRHTLIAAPTGSGKTLAALLPCVNAALVAREETDSGKATSVKDTPPKGVRTIYITPLKALNNDIQHHVVGFAKELEAVAQQLELGWPGYRSGVRTGDTPSSQRASMLRKPPELLITTPESLFILLTSEKGRTMLRTVEHVIVDEIHELAGDKRGSHLSLSLERLAHNAGRRIQRIGVSATQKPLSRVAAFLGGWTDQPETDHFESMVPGPNDTDGLAAPSKDEVHPLGYARRPVFIVESRMEKRMAVSLTMPDMTQAAVSREAVWLPILQRLFALMEGCKSVLIFTNSRRLCERLVLRINDHAGYEMARAHHGSMAKERRLAVEAMLKEGELRCIVATSSLELGIDVGHIDLVIQIDSPLDAASGIQRVGRAGHSVGDVSRGAIVIRNRGALPEAAVLSRCVAEREIDPIVIPQRPIDVLSQQTIAIVAASSPAITADELYRLVTRSDSYRRLPLGLLERMLGVLAGFYPFFRPLLDWNRETGALTKRGNTAAAAITGAGTIPQSSQYPVHHIDSRAHLGELDEEFVHESRVGDVFLLGTNSWMIRKIDKDRIYVSETNNSFSEIPFWRNEGMGRSLLLGTRIGAFLEKLSEKLGLDRNPERERLKHWSQLADMETLVPDASRRESAMAMLREDCGMDDYSAGELIAYVASQHAFSELPTDRCIVIEQYRDMTNQTHVIVLNPFGRRINRTWLLALQRRFETLLPYSLYGNAKDNGIEFVLPEWDASWLRIFGEVTPANLEQLLAEAITGSPLLAIAFRRIAETSLLLSRSFTRTPMWQKRLRSEELLRDSLPYAEQFPYLEEAMRECLHDYLDMEGLRRILASVQSGDINVIIRETEFPSPMATQFLADYVSMKLYEGDGLDIATQAGLLNVSKELAGALFGQEAVKGAVSREVLIAEEERLKAAAGTAGGTEELYTLLKRRGDSGEDELIRLAGTQAVDWIAQLRSEGRILSWNAGEGINRWICADEATVYVRFPEEADAVAFVMNRFIEGRMSYTEPELCERYPAITLQQAREITDELLRTGRIQQAPFAADAEERIWTSSKLAARVLRLSLHEAREKAQPLAAARWCSFLADRQHALRSSQVRGSEGILAVLRKLQGLFLPASHWESFVFPARIPDYRKEDLDMLCASGELVWLGGRQDGQKEGRIAFFLTDQAALYAPVVEAAKDNPTAHPELLELLKESGASFLTGLSRAYGKPPSETMADLLELVWEGHASNDQFAPLRLQATRKGKDWNRTGSGFGRWYWSGSLVSQHRQALSKKDPTAETADSVVHWIHQLLEGYGIVTKELVQSASPFSWDELLPLLNKLEEWGTITRGRFIEGSQVMQFTTPEIASMLHRRPAARTANKAAVPGVARDTVQDRSHDMVESISQNGTPRTLGSADKDNAHRPSGSIGKNETPGTSGDADQNQVNEAAGRAGKNKIPGAQRKEDKPETPPAEAGSAGRDNASAVISAPDPANPFGLIIDWPPAEGRSFARKPGSFIVVSEGEWTYWIENNGKRVHVMGHAGENERTHNAGKHERRTDNPNEDGQRSVAELRHIFGTILRRQGLTKIVIEQWNGKPVMESSAAELLRTMGAERDRQSYVLWMSRL